MGVDRIVLSQGNGTVKPKKGDTVRLAYTGCLYDESKNANYHQGEQCGLRIAPINKQSGLLIPCRFGTSESLGDGVFETAIGVGKVIEGTCYQISYLKEEAKRLQRLGRWCFGDECR